MWQKVFLSQDIMVGIRFIYDLIHSIAVHKGLITNVFQFHICVLLALFVDNFVLRKILCVLRRQL